MNRRNFLSTLIGGIAATAATRQFPFRVFSFPTELKKAPQISYSIKFIRAYDSHALDALTYSMQFGKNLASGIDEAAFTQFQAPGTKLTIRKPYRFLTPKELNQKFPNAQVLTV